MNIRKLRELKGITQKECAKQLGFEIVTYNGYENEKREPDIKTLCRIADYFNVSLDYLCEHKTNTLADFGALSQAQKMAVSILLQLPESNFYEYLGRLKTTADILKIAY